MTERIGDVDEHGRVLLDPKVIPDPMTAPGFGRWRGGLIHPDRVRFVISESQHAMECPALNGWVASTNHDRTVTWWGLCSRCHPQPDGGRLPDSRLDPPPDQQHLADSDPVVQWLRTLTDTVWASPEALIARRLHELDQQ